MKKLWDLKKVFSNLELEGQGRDTIMGVTRLLLLGLFYTIQTKRDQTLCTRVYLFIKQFVILQAFIPTSVMLPAKRLNTLLEQSQEFQTDRCLRHSLKTGNGILPPALDPSFLCRDHKCGELTLIGMTQCARTDLNKRFLPKPMTTTGWKGPP